MPFDLRLSESLSGRGWKAKIRDRERLETPHITVLLRTRSWRVSLRDLTFLDRAPPPRDVPREIVDAIAGNLRRLQEARDAM